MLGKCIASLFRRGAPALLALPVLLGAVGAKVTSSENATVIQVSNDRLSVG